MTITTEALFDQRYRAMKAKDARFDGQFITGVHTTGIYCRPSCPARTPHPQNVSFYLTAAAAHEAGLRACKRCLPDAVPGSPEWNLRDDLSARAMRLIDDGVVDREGVDGLAAHLGYTPRHLGRVLTAELGVGPQALARAHRAQGARMLLQRTDLPVSQVAFASGFASIRAFNDTIKAVYEMTPSRLRETGRRGGVARLRDRGEASTDLTSPGGGTVTLTLPARQPFDGGGLLRFFAAHAIAGVERVDDGVYRRTLRLPGGHAVIAARPTETGVTCTASLQNLADLSTLGSRVRRLFDLDADALAIDEVLEQVPGLRASLEAAPGMRVPGAVDAHEVLFRTLIGQQVSVKAARTVQGTLTAALGDTCGVAAGAGLALLFPTAEQFAEGGAGVLRGPTRRVQAILGAAEALASGRLVIDVGVSLAELTERLTSLPGIGPWTAGYVAMRVLGAPDVLLDGDLALRAGAKALGLPDDRRELVRFAERVSPWRSYFGMHLWRDAVAKLAA